MAVEYRPGAAGPPWPGADPRHRSDAAGGTGSVKVCPPGGDSLPLLQHRAAAISPHRWRSSARVDHRAAATQSGKLAMLQSPARCDADGPSCQKASTSPWREGVSGGGGRPPIPQRQSEYCRRGAWRKNKPWSSRQHPASPGSERKRQCEFKTPDHTPPTGRASHSLPTTEHQNALEGEGPSPTGLVRGRHRRHSADTAQPAPPAGACIAG